MHNQPIVKTFVLLTGSSLSLFLCAADPILSPGDTDLIRDRQERLLQEQQRKLDELQQLPGDTTLAAPELADESRCFDIKEIRLSGVAHISEAQQSKLLKPFIGQCLGASGIDTLMKTPGPLLHGAWPCHFTGVFAEAGFKFGCAATDSD